MREDVHSPAGRVSLGRARSCVSGGVQGDTMASQEGGVSVQIPWEADVEWSQE